MAAFASCRRSGWVRVLVVILCALFIFATIATPPAYAVGETAALFGAAAVLSAAVAALGFKLSNDSDGIATLNKMVTDFSKEVWALNLLVVGNRINGLIDGMNYIKMAVHNGKTYLDERVVAWCQQWLSNNGVYDAGDISFPDYVSGQTISLDYLCPFSTIQSVCLASGANSSRVSYFNDLISHFNISFRSGYVYVFKSGTFLQIIEFPISFQSASIEPVTLNDQIIGYSVPFSSVSTSSGTLYQCDFTSSGTINSYYSSGYGVSEVFYLFCNVNDAFPDGISFSVSSLLNASFSDNSTGLSGTDTIGEDYKDKTLDQILDGLKDWAQDWYDAGADSATNTATGALDLPVTVGDQAATANPALNPDVVYNPPFSIPWPGVRSGETSSGAISDGKANADAAETAITDVAENQSVIDSLVNWALNYINPDTGLFSKFPLCVPYDAYLLVTSSLGVDAVGSDSIFGASPGDLDGVVSQDIETYSDFQPIINIKHDFQLDGATYPLELTIDLTPWQPLVTFFREGMALLLVAELIGAEFKRIRGH